jgi:SAM-dependent methyltransferase
MALDTLAFSNSSESVVVRALCRDLLDAGINLDISTADEMLRFFLFVQGHGIDQAVAMYLESGRRIWATQRQILAWRFGSPASVQESGGRILDFASGYGRVTRHLVADVPKDRVWVSDIYAEGVAFQEREFGVHGVVSTTDPKHFQCDQSFDCVLVSSLFTHLPEARFVEWLRCLGALVKPGGLLLFSVHDMALRGEPSPAVDILFEELSESGSLDTKDYGSAWVTERFVRSAARDAVGPWPLLRIPRGLASFQDLYVLLKEESEASEPFASLRLEREADGFLEHCSWGGRRTLRLSGWAADRVTGVPPGEVRILIDGDRVASCRDLEPRPSIAKAFASDPMDVVGWQATIEIPPASNPASARLSVRPVSSQGEEMNLYTGSVAEACLRSSLLDTAMLQGQMAQQEAAGREELSRQKDLYERRLTEQGHEIASLAHRLQAMEASRFWKARNLWFGFKRAAGLTTER